MRHAKAEVVTLNAADLTTLQRGTPIPLVLPGRHVLLMFDGVVSATGAMRSPRKGFRCRICKKLLPSKQALGGHVNIHTAEQRAKA